jgi:predicted nuclease of restriction endonuclease-like (RecB) superfamily
MMEHTAMDRWVEEIKEIMATARQKISNDVNRVIIETSWRLGKSIVENEQNGELKAQYGKKVLAELSKRLTLELGKGYSKSNLYNMRDFYIVYPKFQTLSGKLTWSHYIELKGVTDADARSFYEYECANSHWSVEELKRQIGTSLFERFLLSDGKPNKEKVLSLARQGAVLEKPEDLLKQPYVFEFLGVREEKPMLEKTLEMKLMRHIEDFLLELGRGFMFVGSQQRITIGNTHYYVDMAFYNKILKAYVLFDLKMGELKPEHAGQMNAYLNYYKTEVNDVDDNPPIGIILCRTSKEIVAEYALGGLSNQVFASNYVYYIPDKELLINEVKHLLENEDSEDVLLD